MIEVSKCYDELAGMTSEIQQLADQGDAQAKAALEEVTSKLDRLKRYYGQLDVQRRLDLRISPEDAALPVPQTWWGKAQTFFISQGLWSTLRRPGRAVYASCLLLLIPSLLGIYSLPVLPGFDQRIVHLGDLEVELSQKEALARWQQIIASPAEPERDLNDGEKQTLRVAARSFEWALARSQALSFFDLSPNAARAVRSNGAREAVLQVAADAAPTSVEKVQAASHLETDAIRRRQWELIDQAVSPEAPLGRVGQQVYDDLSRHARRDRGFVANLRRSLQTPTVADEIAHGVGRGMLGALFGDAPGGELMGGLDPETSLAVRESFETRRHNFVSDLVENRGDRVDDALRRVVVPRQPDLRQMHLGQMESFSRRSPFSAAPGSDGLLASISEHPPSLEPRTPASVDVTRATRSVERLLPQRGSLPVEQGIELVQRGTQALAEFSNYFPASYSTAGKTPQASAMTRMLTKSGVQDVSAIVAKAFKGVAGNSRSFVGLRGSTRVGGVLIGTRPDDESKRLDYRDLSWEIDGPRVRFFLKDARGQTHTSRWWRASIAAQALTYAADGRPLAVTMVDASPQKELENSRTFRAYRHGLGTAHYGFGSFC